MFWFIICWFDFFFMGWKLRFWHVLRLIVLEIAKSLLLVFLTFFYFITWLFLLILFITKPIKALFLILRHHGSIHLWLNHAVECIKLIIRFFFVWNHGLTHFLLIHTTKSIKSLVILLILWHHWTTHSLWGKTVESIKIISWHTFWLFRWHILGFTILWSSDLWNLRLIINMFFEIFGFILMRLCFVLDIISIGQDRIAHFLGFEVTKIRNILLVFLLLLLFIFNTLWLLLLTLLFYNFSRWFGMFLLEILRMLLIVRYHGITHFLRSHIIKVTKVVFIIIFFLLLIQLVNANFLLFSILDNFMWFSFYWLISLLLSLFLFFLFLLIWNHGGTHLLILHFVKLREVVPIFLWLVLVKCL